MDHISGLPYIEVGRLAQPAGLPDHPGGLMQYEIEMEPEDDGRWIAEVPGLSGVLTYGRTRDEAAARVQALALPIVR